MTARPGPPRAADLDDIDRALLRHLQVDARASLAELGQGVALSVSAVNERVRKLERQGYVRGWRADLDPAAVGAGVLAFVFVAVERPDRNAGFLSAVTGDPAVLECHHVTGGWSYLLKVRVADIPALERFLTGRLKSIAGVARSETMIALSSIKETAILPLGGDGAADASV